MLIEKVRKLKPLDRIIYWCKMREEIRLAKEAGKPRPWTDDEILMNYRFCNIVRITDKVSQWLLKNWFMPHKDRDNMLAACAVARFFNEPRTLELIGFPDVSSVKAYDAWAKQARAKLMPLRGKVTLFRAAYVVRGNNGRDKVDSVLRFYVRPLVAEPVEVDTDSMQNTWYNLLQYFGMGSFMSGQIVADARWAISGRWLDKKKWAPLGPGSKRGMNRVLERDLNAPMNQEEFDEHLTWLMGVYKEKLPRALFDKMEAIDAQNSCCEYDKMCRALDGTGRPKQKFNGR